MIEDNEQSNRKRYLGASRSARSVTKTTGCIFFQLGPPVSLYFAGLSFDQVFEANPSGLYITLRPRLREGETDGHLDKIARPLIIMISADVIH